MPDKGPTKGPRVPDYELLRRIGHGAYGDVWLARSQATGVLRAAKIVWRRSFEDDRPFRREFEGIQRFEHISREHPSQLALFHIGRNEPGGYFYYVMELADRSKPGPNAEGHTVAHGIALPDVNSYTPHTLRADLEKGRLPAAKVLEIGLVLSEALYHLHRNGLVHRDVKPSNVIFVNGRPKLADIGLVTDASDQCSIVGTEGYLPPEGPGTPQADIFALGKVMYEAATGMDRREFPKLPEDLRSWPDAKMVFEINEIILRACAHKPAGRYQICEQMQADLELLGRGRSVKRQRALRRHLAVARKVFLVAALAGLCVIGLVVVAHGLHKAPSRSKNPVAQELYEQAVYEMRSGALDRLQQAYTNLDEAVKLDPEFVDAHFVMLSLYKALFAEKLPPYYNQLGNLRMVATNLGKLAPGSARYYTVDSLVKFLEWKFDKAVEEAERAIRLDPELARAHAFYGFYVLMAYGDADRAEQEIRLAKKFEPADATIQTILAGPFYSRRDYVGAIAQGIEASKLERQAPLPHRYLARAYEALAQHDERKYDEALNEYEQFDVLCGRGPVETRDKYIRWRAALHDKGASALWEAELEEIQSKNPSDYYQIARIYARKGDTDRVISFLDKAYEQHNDAMQYLLDDDAWDRYRGGARFQELARKMGFHPVSKATD